MIDYQVLIQKVKKAGFDDLNIVEKGESSLEITTFLGKVEKNTFSKILKISLKAIKDGKMVTMEIENFDMSYDFIVDHLLKNVQIIDNDEKNSIYAGSNNYPKITLKEADFVNIPTSQKIEMLQTIEKKIFASDKRITIVECGYSEVQEYTKIINSQGLNIQKENGFVFVSTQSVATEKEKTQTGYYYVTKEQYKDINIDEIVKENVKKTISMLNALPIPSKKYPTIIENSAMISLMSAFASIFSGEAAIKKITPLLNKENTKIMSEKITICDNYYHDETVVKEPFDDEGVACYSKEVVSKGVFKTFLHNLKTAQYFNTSSTGNGFNGGVSGINFYIEKGNTSKEEMVSSISEGLVVTQLDGLHAGVNAISGDFSLKASGFLVEKGKVTKPVTLIVVAGNFFKIMNDIEMVGSDLKFDFYGNGAPSIKFRSLAVSGI